MSAPLPTFPDESRFRDSEINCFHDVEMARGPFAQFFYVIWDVPEPPLTITTWVEHIWDPIFFFQNGTGFLPIFRFGSLGTETRGLVSETPETTGISRVNGKNAKKTSKIEIEFTDKENSWTGPFNF